MQKTTKVFVYLEKLNREKYPECVKQLLIECGYDKVLSLQELDAEKLHKIEKHINENRHMIEKLNCCNAETYKVQREFHFIPGHEAIVLGIPAQIKKYRENRSKKSQLAKNKSNMSEDVLKNSLIVGLEKYATKVGFSLPQGVFSDRNILNFRREMMAEKEVYKCTFSCPFCSKTTPVIYKLYWMSSNVTKHLKGHLLTQLAAPDQLAMMQTVVTQ